MLRVQGLTSVVFHLTGSQAQDSGSVASVQLAKIQDGARVYLSQVKDQAQKTLDLLDGTEYEEYK